MLYNGIIGDLQYLKSIGCLNEDGINDYALRNCLNSFDDVEKSRLKIVSNRVMGAAKMGAFWETFGDIFSKVFGAVTGGKKDTYCPPCPPSRQPDIFEQFLPVLIGFGIGYFLIPKKR